MKNFKFFALTLIILFQSINLAESTPSTYNKLKYESSLVYTQFTSTGWWTKIEPYNLYLGALPLIKPFATTSYSRLLWTIRGTTPQQIMNTFLPPTKSLKTD